MTVIEASSSQIYDAAAKADVVLAETPTNPALDVIDVHRLATICRGRNARLIVDNTAATPLGQQPLSLGADAVVASATKALSGHGDLLAGYVATSEPELLAAVERQRLLAECDPGWIRGMPRLLRSRWATAGLRLKRQCHNARALATMLARHAAVRAVRYPGLVDDPAHPVAMAQMRRFGSLVSVELADAAAVHALVDRSELLIASTSFRRPAYVGGPPGALGRPGRRRIRTHLAGYRRHRRPARRHRTCADGHPADELTFVAG